MQTVYRVGEVKVVMISATFGIVKDGEIVYRSNEIEDAIETADEIQGSERAA
jgi:hypothetical protein